MWKPLRLNRHGQAEPCLLVKYDFGPTDYTIHVTDMTYCWTESLDRKQIIKEALELNTSIDPSEDGNQMRLFLNHIKRSFDGASGTLVSLKEKYTSNKLSLNVCVTLPSPLIPLEWPVTLSQDPQDVLTSELVLPCLSQICSLKVQIDSLLQHLREKDNVIGKLTDSMQSNGTDLSRLFPGTASHRSGSRLTPREAISKSVKGMADFNQSDWRQRLPIHDHAPRSIHELVDTVFVSDHGDAQVAMPLINSQSGWCERIQHDGLQRAKAENTSILPEPQSSRAMLSRDVDSSFGDFQRQSTPPSRSPDIGGLDDKNKGVRETRPKRDSTDGDTTTDDGDSDHLATGRKLKATETKLSPLRQLKSHEPNNGVESPPSMRSTHQATAKPILPSRVLHSPITAANDTETEEDQESLLAKVDCKGGSNSKSDAKPKRKLGKIGNRNKTLVQTTDDEGVQAKQTSVDGESTNDQSSPLPMKPKNKLGGIGGKVKREGSGHEPRDLNMRSTPSLPAENEGSLKNGSGSNQKSSQVMPNSPTPAAPQSPGKISELQANENRERLKRELEAKSNNASKKKRKF